MANMRDFTPNQLLSQQKKGGTVKGSATKEINRRTAEFTEQAEKHQANNPERYQTVTDEGFFKHPETNPVIDGARKFKPAAVDNLAGTVESSNTKMSARGVYRAMNYGANSEAESTQGHPTLPGVEEQVAHQYKMPVRDVLSPEQNAHIEKQAAMFGVTRESARAAAGAHIDQALRRDPQHQSFYTTEGQDATGLDHPRERLLRSAHEAGVPAPVHAMTNAITSPRVKFAEKRFNPETGQKDIVQYTNDDNARQASIAGKAGGDAVKNVKNLPGRAGFLNRTQDAAKKADAVLNGGKTIREAWDSPSPKTGPFHNSWVDANGPDQRWVADTHSGAPLVAPHVQGDEQKVGFMNIKHKGATIHQWIHERASEAMAERGLSSVSGTQSAHWNLQREQSEAAGNRTLQNQQHIHTGSRSEHFAHGADPDQLKLF